ncbi:MAG: HTTM domain-containing protein [Myxococcales bacterium]|nr:HTTM domain-containing protein [Myxococcales bacterium]
MGRLAIRLAEPIDPRSIAAFRALFGGILFIAIVRFAANGWIDSQLAAPTYHFTYAGFRFVRPLPGVWLWVHFAVMAVAALALALGVRPRLAAAVFCLLFTWAELIEKAAYLNHYCFVSLMTALLAVVRTDGAFALWPAPGPAAVSRGALLLLRAQVALVYFYAGFAKIDADWLLRAEPLATWLPAHADWPLIGPLLAASATAYAFSWLGMLFDLTIWAFLAWSRTRRVAFAVAVFFHLAVWALFPIGLFSPLMLAAATLFFAPGWPRWGRAPASPRPRPSRALLALAGAWLAVQLFVPLRFLLYPGPVNWTEEGFRFAWRVMLVEKTGHIEYRLRSNGRPERRVVPGARLTPLQARMLAIAPDFIIEYAHHLAEEARDAGETGVEVRADAFVAFNGRPAQRLVDPEVDLAAQPMFTWAPAGWIRSPHGH